MKVISLFSGCGGLDLGFERQDIEVVWACENAKAAVNTYRHNLPHTHVCDQDIRNNWLMIKNHILASLDSNIHELSFQTQKAVVKLISMIKKYV